jgi:beta-glucosidase
MEPAGQAPKPCAGAAPDFLRAAGGLAALASIVIAVHASDPDTNRNPDPDARADALVRAMTLDEKIHLLHGTLGFAYEGRPAPHGARGGAGFIAALPRLGIPAIQLNDGPLGVRNIGGGPDSRATAFPSSQALAATFDVELAEASGRIMGGEARVRGFNVLLAGGVAIERDAWNGRNFEYLGEDPILAARLVTAQLRGIQSQGVVSTVKHLVANTQETDRHWVDMKADERSLREIDLLPFEIAVKESGVGSVMCAYNRLNGIYACENAELLNGIVKSEWGFKGWIISDWGATHSTAAAANAGLDQEFYEARYFSGALKEAVESGEVPEGRIDDMARRILRSLAAVGALDRDEPPRPVDAAAGLAVAQRVAESGIVLLQNRGGLLPLRADAVKRIAVIGRRADVGVLAGSGSSGVDSIGGVAIDDTPSGTAPEMVQFMSTLWHRSSPRDAIAALAPSAKVEFATGEDIAAAAGLAASADVAIVFAWQARTEGKDLPNLSLPAGQDELIRKVSAANPRTVVVLQAGGSALTPWAPEVGAILAAWYPGNRGGEAIANILFGRVNPSGRLPISFPRAESDLPRPKPPQPKADPMKPVAPAVTPVVELAEGLAVGYRWYDSRGKAPAYEFGFGLTYTTFAYSNLEVSGDLSVEFDLVNTGERHGVEVAQFYLEFPRSADEPAKRLAGWARVALTPGERRRVRITPDPYALIVWDAQADGWRRPPGRYRVHVGASSRILPLVQEIDVRDVQGD